MTRLPTLAALSLLLTAAAAQAQTNNCGDLAAPIILQTTGTGGTVYTVQLRNTAARVLPVSISINDGLVGIAVRTMTQVSIPPGGTAMPEVARGRPGQPLMTRELAAAMTISCQGANPRVP